MAALQLAEAAGANVVATTSSEEKADRLKALGAAHVINYRTNEDWGVKAKALTPNGIGFDIVVDVTGNEGFRQSIASTRIDGIVVMVGMVGDATAEPVALFETFFATCITRAILASSRTQFKDVVKFIDEKKIVPAIDDVEFELAEVKDAYRRIQDKKHFSKIVIRID